jgi:hypothetical protein
MSATTSRQVNLIERDFNSFMIYYDSIDLGDPANVGTKCVANIICFNNQQQAGILRFHERQPPPVNSYRGTQPNAIPLINYHISRFNDIIHILRSQKQLTLSFDLVRLEGGLVSINYEPIGQQG